ELNRQCNLIAKGLLELGVQKGDKVCIMMDNCPEYLYAWLGASKMGAVEVSINTAYKGETLRYIIDNSDANTILIHSQYLNALERVLQDLVKLKNIILIPEPKDQSVDFEKKGYALSCFTLDKLRDRGAKTKLPIPEVKPHDLAMLGYTSGTTGESKGVMIPHHRLVCTAYDIAGIRHVDKHEILYTCLPLFHGNAKILTALTALIGDGQLALGKRFSASKFWDEIRQYQATQFNYLGAMTAILFKRPEEENDNKQPAKIGFGAGCPVNIHEAFEKRFGLILQEGYGLTEAGVPLGTIPSKRKIGSCGQALFQYDVKIVDENDNEVPIGATGELVILPKRPYSVMMGYYKRPEETLKAFRNLMVHTGDLAYRDEEGYFYFADRKKDAIRRRGENISSQEVEAVIDKNDNVLESVVFPVPAEVSEDEVMAIVVLKGGHQLSTEGFFKYCSENMPYFWVPRYVEIWSEPLPKTPTGKIEKYRMKERGVTEKTVDREKLDSVKG
ncbi:MAG: AMP-binding protein, partial [Candidatus Thorarchaeota archaeon]